MKKDINFFNWLNSSVFFKNQYITKRSYDDKRVTLCNSHKKQRNIKK